ncbi:hypothetical protein DVH24_027592 [Malus domestica]|uniref:Uncharacterized protein n=1 Tax=Malus domestica TaxID=3750 RepID=A0A498HDD3_MALDO|nr:hypothetical protein DVH24_027592 [Malus domestica]
MRRLYRLPFLFKFHQLLCTIGCPSWPIYSPRSLRSTGHTLMFIHDTFDIIWNREMLYVVMFHQVECRAWSHDACPNKKHTQENLVLVLTANHEDPDFWRYLEANFHVEFKYEQNPTLESGTNQQFKSPAKTTTTWGKWNEFSHGSNMPVYPPQSPNPLINIYYPHYDEATKNVILKDEHFPSDLPGFGVNVIPPWSNEIGYVKHGSSGKQPCISGDTDKLMIHQW